MVVEVDEVCLHHPEGVVMAALYLVEEMETHLETNLLHWKIIIGKPISFTFKLHHVCIDWTSGKLLFL